MEFKEYLESIGIDKQGEYNNDGYVVPLIDSNDYGKVFSILEKSDDLDILEDNQVITDEGSSLMYESISEPFLLNLIADWEANIYQLIVIDIDGGEDK